MSARRGLIAAVIASLLAPLAAATDFKIGTVAPLNSTWDKALKAMASAIGKDTGGRIVATVLPAGNATEDTIVTAMRPGFERYQAAYVSIVPLAQTEPSFTVFSIPFFLENEGEEQAVEKALKPILDKKLQAAGFHLLGWGTAGWVQLFSKRKITDLNGVKAAKLYTSKGPGSDKWKQWYLSNGFNPVELPPSAIGEQLKLPTGQIDAAPIPPLLASGSSLYRDAPFMLDVHIAPLTGALIVSNAAWNKFSEDDRAKLTAAAEAMEAAVRRDVPQQEVVAIKSMTEHGLTVVKPDAKAAADIRAAATKLAGSMKGTMVPEDVFNAALQARDAYRKSQGK
jgi:TRAP-type C4-dicarboxylate transport system substrate-binding protein